MWLSNSNYFPNTLAFSSCKKRLTSSTGVVCKVNLSNWSANGWTGLQISPTKSPNVHRAVSPDTSESSRWMSSSAVLSEGENESTNFLVISSFAKTEKCSLVSFNLVLRFIIFSRISASRCSSLSWSNIDIWGTGKKQTLTSERRNSSDLLATNKVINSYSKTMELLLGRSCPNTLSP